MTETLPSRESAATVDVWDNDDLNRWIGDVAIPLAVYWQSGRLMDWEAIEKKQLIEQFVGKLDERERYLHDAEFHALIEVLVVTLLDLPVAALEEA